MKTVDEYMNDPSIVNDSDMVNALEPIKRIHAIRLKIQDEKSQIGEAEYNKKVMASLEQRGISICHDLVGDRVN